MTLKQSSSSPSGKRIGIDLGGTKIEIAVLERDGTLSLRTRVPTPSQDYEGIVRAIRDLVRGVDQRLGELVSVGIGAPGSISHITGRVKNSNTQCVNDKPLVEDLQSAIGRSVRIANDANCFALSEAVDGAGRDARVVFGVILGTGVGGGIVVDRSILVGPNGIAGEWGHNPLPWANDDERPGALCYCGTHGCIETFLCGAGLARTYEQLTGVTITAPEVADRANAGEPTAEQALQSYEHRLARGLAAVINLLDPDVVVLGGGLSRMDRLYKNVPNTWTSHIFSDSVRTSLRPAVHGDSGGVRGAAWLWPVPGESGQL